MTAIGIDLGATLAVVASCKNDQASVIAIDDQEHTPAAVYIDLEGTKIVGQNALRRVALDPEQGLIHTKHYLGIGWKKRICGINYSAADATRELLAYLKRETEKKIGEKIEQVVLTIPAWFDEPRRSDVQKAAKNAGLRILALAPAPLAAMLGAGVAAIPNQPLLVIDIGATTVEFSILSERDGTLNVVTGSAEEHKLGGNDFDHALVRYFSEVLRQNTDIAAEEVMAHNKKLKEIAEKTKIALAQNPVIDIAESLGDLSLSLPQFGREKLAELIEPYLAQVVDKAKRLLHNQKTVLESLGGLLLIGGSARHPVVRDYISRHLKEPFDVADPDTCTARGGALIAHQHLTEHAVEVATTEKNIGFSLGVDIYLEELKQLQLVHVLKKNSRYPAKGVVIGCTQPRQSQIRMRVYRGENINMLEKNSKIGELVLPIRAPYAEAQYAVAVVFSLDENEVLTVTGIEIPPEQSILIDPLFQKIMNIAEQNNYVVPYADIALLSERYNLNHEEIILSLTASGETRS